jgi:PAS domain S-box-containing protein
MHSEGKRIQWMVWGLVAVAFAVGVITIGIIGWTLSNIRIERTEMAEEQRRLGKSSEEISRLALKSREEILVLLAGGTIQQEKGQAIGELQQLVQQQLSSTTDDELQGVLKKAVGTIVDFEGLWQRANTWNSHYTLVNQDLRQQRTLQEVRHSLQSLGGTVETLEGQRRLQEAIKLRRWRNAKGTEASRLAEGILQGQVTQQTQALREVRNELADVAQYVEMLAGEQQADNLTNIKDNKLKPSLERLTRSMKALRDTETLAEPLSPARTEAVYVALFGKGFSIDEAHQTVRVGTGGLYSLRHQFLGLRNERETLRTELRNVFQQIEDIDDEFSSSTHEHATTLARGVEERLTDVRDNMLLMGGVSFILFLGLAWMISRGIQKQVSAMGEARAVADKSNQTAQRLLVEQQAAAEALRQAEEKFHSIFENAVEGIYQSTLDGRFLSVNPAMARMYGFETPEALMEHITDISRQVYVNASDREAFAHLFKTQGRVHGFEYQVYRQDGETFWVSENARAVKDQNGTIMYFEGTIQDISERKQAQEELHRAKEVADQANKAKSDFLASMSHELRTPLNGILGYAQILKRDPSLTDKQKSGVDIIQRSGDHLLTLINDILDLSKIEAQKLELQLTEFHLPDFLQQIANIIRVRAEQAEISFLYEPVSDLPAGVRGDEKRLRQVLLNLLGNAVKFTEKGGAALKVGYDDAQDFPDLLRFQVEDTGRGIPHDQLEGIFQPFQQVKNQSQHIEGTGLGLAITKKLVTLMGGELGVTSNPGKGSTFWFTVSLPAVETSQVKALPVDKTILGYKGERKRILVVDDKPTNRGIVLNLLEPLGFHVQEAENGQEALAKITEPSPNLIIMDLIMPVMDGIEATRRIRQLPGGKDVTIIASSASVFEFNQQDSLKAGCNDFLNKPIRADELFEKLRTYLELEWIYESEGTQEDVQEGGVAVLVAPPKEELQMLADLVGKGKITGIRQRIKQIEQLGDEYRPFTTELDRLAKSFDMDQLTDFLKPYLEGLE